MNINNASAAKAEILQRLYEYSWGYDSNNMELLGSVFSEQAQTGGVIAHRNIGWGPWYGRDKIVEELSIIRNSQNDQRRHVITSTYFEELTVETAIVYVYLSLFTRDENTKPHLITTGTYIMKCKKYESIWLIDLLEEVLEAPF